MSWPLTTTNCLVYDKDQRLAAYFEYQPKSGGLVRVFQDQTKQKMLYAVDLVSKRSLGFLKGEEATFSVKRDTAELVGLILVIGTSFTTINPVTNKNIARAYTTPGKRSRMSLGWTTYTLCNDEPDQEILYLGRVDKTSQQLERTANESLALLDQYSDLLFVCNLLPAAVLYTLG
jgi:hypothetical protein